MSIKITRTLYVGLGGTGVKSILRTKQCFVDAYGEVPPMVAFLAIDTDRGIRNKSVLSRMGKEVKLSENELCFCGIVGSALEIYRNHLSQFQWLPRRNSQFLSNLMNTGAGQIRSNGRFLARHNATDISARVASKVSEICAPLPVGCKFAYDTNKDGVEYPTKVNIVGSVAGGTGSGTMLDIIVLVAKTLRELGHPYSITPWIVLPEVFRNMVNGPATANVYQNAYGAIRELDYLYHLPYDNQNALDFGFANVYYLDEGVRDAYLINNRNKMGVVLQTVDEITDSIGRCMFLPSGELDSVKDNIDKGYYSIKNKKAFYSSAGSAEIVYDNKAVGNVVAHGIVAQICKEQLSKPDPIATLKTVNTWMESDAVAIQEHDANLLIDSILAYRAPFSVIIDRTADVNTIKANITAGAEAANVSEEADDNVETKLANVKSKLDEKIRIILNSLQGVGLAQAFLEALQTSITLCKDEMVKEVGDLQKKLAYNVDWSADISDLRTGILSIFNRDAAVALQNKVEEYIAQKRDLLRHQKAIQFFTDFDQYVCSILSQITVLKANVEAIQKKNVNAITTIQQAAKTPSKFQIFLHSDDVNDFVLPDVAETSALFIKEHPIEGLINQPAETIDAVLFNFAKGLQSVADVKNVTIEHRLSKMTDADLRRIFDKVKEMSSPLWSTDTHGKLDHAQELTTVFTIGVYNQSKGIIQSGYSDMFMIGATKPIFESIHQTDRITFFQSQCFSPAFAVNNMLGYMREAEDKYSSEACPVCYLDERWNQRMIVENFDLMPKQEKDIVLPNWVNAIVYGFIKYDESRKSYCIESSQGDILSGGLLELGQRRDIAFDQFQLRGLGSEVEARIQKMILDQGRPAVVAVMKKAQEEYGKYLLEIANLSTIERERVIEKDAAYQMVRDLLEREVVYLRELEF
ncbi:MAG: hypothetical protein IJX65_04400 [Alistipes sp.]|nr:hypothetical protein [Alistipes sp.]